MCDTRLRIRATPDLMPANVARDGSRAAAAEHCATAVCAAFSGRARIARAVKGRE